MISDYVKFSFFTNAVYSIKTYVDLCVINTYCVNIFTLMQIRTPGEL